MHPALQRATGLNINFFVQILSSIGNISLLLSVQFQSLITLGLDSYLSNLQQNDVREFGPSLPLLQPVTFEVQEDQIGSWTSSK
jgi:hypothetical protein